MNTVSFRGSTDQSPGCYGMFTCISNKCKSCPSAFECARDSGSSIAHVVMVKAKLRIVADYRERGLNPILTDDGKIEFH